MVYDCGGYATKFGILCTDGRRIMPGSFDDQDGQTVPLVWQHKHNEPSNVLGHALLEKRSDGMYAYCKFNNTENGQTAKTLVEHGDIDSFSIYANGLVQKSRDVIHGSIKEVSLVIAGANSGARIDNLLIEHSDGEVDSIEDEAIIYPDVDDKLEHSVEKSDTKPENQNGGDSKVDKEKESGKTAKEVFDTLNDEQKTLFYAMIGEALSESDEDEEVEHDDVEEDDDDDVIEHNDKGGKTMKKNVFDGEQNKENVLSHEDVEDIMKDAKRLGSLKDAVLEHGITDIDILFPEATAVRPTPDMITRPMDWVARVWNATHKSPFSRIKSVAANLTEDEARAKGYIKGKKKLEEQFGLMKRVTTPQTIYKKQKLDRDDVIDITDFDVVAWLKAEMRMMLNEELARAILVGDGRPTSSDDKINPLNIRPIYQDDDMYTIHYNVTVPAGGDKTEAANAVIDAANYARIDYKGSGTPVFLTSSKYVADMLLAKDKVGHRLYKTTTELAAALRVSDIIEVPVFEGVTREVDGAKKELIGIIVNLNDYTVGADKGGAVTMFDDFDIDYNQMKYLIETRCSGALTLPYSAIALEKDYVEGAAG